MGRRGRAGKLEPDRCPGHGKLEAPSIGISVGEQKTDAQHQLKVRSFVLGVIDQAAEREQIEAVEVLVDLHGFQQAILVRTAIGTTGTLYVTGIHGQEQRFGVPRHIDDRNRVNIQKACRRGDRGSVGLGFHVALRRTPAVVVLFVRQVQAQFCRSLGFGKASVGVFAVIVRPYRFQCLGISVLDAVDHLDPAHEQPVVEIHRADSLLDRRIRNRQ
ncbi:hypothetical protein SOM55_21745, partial [Pseudomonas coleopterorum]